MQIDTTLVPGGCTKFIQALDVCWNRPFKDRIRQEYEDWMLHRERELTTGRNPRPPPITIYLERIVKAWDSIPKEAISKSFNTCAVTNAVDGSEDNEIHCFKPDGPVPTGRNLLKQARVEKKIIKLIEEINLSEDENNNVYDSIASVDG